MLAPALLILSLAALGAMAALSLIAWRRLPPARRLPMQWGLSGRPTWSAPRALALAFTPCLASALILALGLGGVAGPGALAVTALAFLACHLLHLALLRRHLSRG